MPFIIVGDYIPRLLERKTVINRFVKPPEQRELFQIAA